MICLKNRTFAVSQTTPGIWVVHPHCCDLLEKSYFCSIANNVLVKSLYRQFVVICLKNRTFAVSQTTLGVMLRTISGCDLLEKSYFCSIANNIRSNVTYHFRLWFAWKIVLLQYRKQLIFNIVLVRQRCDLLEKSYFCSIANNIFVYRIAAQEVVICLKNRTFAVSQTTGYWLMSLAMSFDFLEKSYFFSIANNSSYLYNAGYTVVICLKNRTFAVSQTTTPENFVRRPALWFAWKIVLLQYRKQQQSNFAFADGVVICLKNRTFAVSQTTE